MLKGGFALIAYIICKKQMRIEVFMEVYMIRRNKKANELGKSGEVKQATDRLEVLEKIKALEKEGIFDVDVENDPPTLPLMPEDIDYLHSGNFNKMKSKLIYTLAQKYVEILMRSKKLILKQINGIENLNSVASGAVITCNHFGLHDCLIVEWLFRKSVHNGKKEMFEVIREGNYTNYPGIPGFMFRNCNTLPLSQIKKTMCNFLKAVDVILQRGDFILIYPEQSMWWNYKKPRPLKNGAFKFASKNNIPVIPIFITMEDSDHIGRNGFFVQRYTVFIEKPIYPRADITKREQAVDMRDRNYECWKNIYEKFYKTTLEYEIDNEQ